MNLLAIDVETTGTDPDKAKPVQISMVLANGKNRRVVMNTLCDPGEPIPKSATTIHGITNKDVHLKPDAHMACWIAEYVAAAFRPDILVTYNGKFFDVPILSRFSGGTYLSSLPHIDVLDMAYRYLPTIENHRLETVYKHVCDKEANNVHNAVADVFYTLDIMEAIRKQLKMSIQKLLEEMSTPKPYTIMPISKYKGHILSDVPTGFAKWLLEQNKNKPMRDDLRLSMETILHG